MHAQRRVIVVALCRSVGQSVYLSARFLSNSGCSRYQMWICGYVQKALGTARVWSRAVKEQHVYGGRLNVQCVDFSRKLRGGYQTWICR